MKKIALLAAALLCTLTLNAFAQQSILTDNGGPTVLGPSTTTVDAHQFASELAKTRRPVVNVTTQRVEYVPSVAEVQAQTKTQLQAQYAFYGLAIFLILFLMFVGGFFLRLIFSRGSSLFAGCWAPNVGPQHVQVDVSGKVCHAHSVHGEVKATHAFRMDLTPEMEKLLREYMDRYMEYLKSRTT